MDIKFFQENTLWKFTAPSGTKMMTPLGHMDKTSNDERLSIKSLPDNKWIIYGVPVNTILKSDTPGDFYNDMEEFNNINEGFFVNAPATGGGIIAGSVSTYANLPEASTSTSGELWYVENGSGGILTWINVYKYPKGLYSINNLNVWALIALKVRYSEDSFTLLNITVWADYFAFAFDINEGDQIVYGGRVYENLTGIQISTAPNVDIVNWKEATPNKIILPFVIGNEAAGNYAAFYPNGEIRLFGEATQWEDMRVPVLGTKRGGSKIPGFEKTLDNGAGSQGVFSYYFDKNTEQELYFDIQLPHSWKQGSNIESHVHWIPKSNGAAGADVCWALEYTWANIGDVFPDTTIIYGDTNHLAEDLITNKHYLTELGEINAAGKTFSSMLVCRVFRDARGQGGTDDYNDDAGLLEIDFHYQIDSFGSNDEYAKYTT